MSCQIECKGVRLVFWRGFVTLRVSEIEQQKQNEGKKMRRVILGIAVAAFALTGCAEATDEGETEGIDVVTNESIPQEWLDDPKVPLGNATIYVNGEPTDRLTLYSGDMGEELPASTPCGQGQIAVCGNNRLYNCGIDGWQEVPNTSHIGSLPSVCRNIMDLKRLAHLRYECSVGEISIRYDGFADDLEDETTYDRNPYTQPGESELTDYTGDYTNPGSEPTGGDPTGGTTQPSSDTASNDPADELDSTSDTTQPGTSSGSTSTSSGGSGSSSGSTSTSSSGDRSGGSSTTQPARY